MLISSSANVKNLTLLFRDLACPNYLLLLLALYNKLPSAHLCESWFSERMEIGRAGNEISTEVYFLLNNSPEGG